MKWIHKKSVAFVNKSRATSILLNNYDNVLILTDLCLDLTHENYCEIATHYNVVYANVSLTSIIRGCVFIYYMAGSVCELDKIITTVMPYTTTLRLIKMKFNPVYRLSPKLVTNV